MTDTYTASDGSKWHLSHDFPPIPVRSCDWSATHDDYDGAPDAGDNRSVMGATRAEACKAVEVLLEEEDDAFFGGVDLPGEE